MSRETERDLEIALEDCHGELAAMIKASNEKVIGMNEKLDELRRGYAQQQTVIDTMIEESRGES